MFLAVLQVRDEGGPVQTPGDEEKWIDRKHVLEDEKEGRIGDCSEVFGLED